MLQKTFSSKLNQTTKNAKNWKKTSEIGLVRTQFYKTELSRGRKRHSVYELFMKNDCWKTDGGMIQKETV